MVQKNKKIHSYSYMRWTTTSPCPSLHFGLSIHMSSSKTRSMSAPYPFNPDKNRKLNNWNRPSQPYENFQITCFDFSFCVDVWKTISDFLRFYFSKKYFFINSLFYFNIPKDLFFQNDIFNFNLKDTSCLNNKRQTALSAESKLSFQISFVTRQYANLRLRNRHFKGTCDPEFISE